MDSFRQEWTARCPTLQYQSRVLLVLRDLEQEKKIISKADCYIIHRIDFQFSIFLDSIPSLATTNLRSQYPEINFKEIKK